MLNTLSTQSGMPADVERGVEIIWLFVVGILSHTNTPCLSMNLFQMPCKRAMVSAVEATQLAAYGLGIGVEAEVVGQGILVAKGFATAWPRAHVGPAVIIPVHMSGMTPHDVPATEYLTTMAASHQDSVHGQLWFTSALAQ